MESGTFAADAVTRLLERLAYQVGAAAHNHGEESIHELRLAIRRFTQSLAIFKRLYDAKELKKIRRRLKDLMDLSGPVRDYDVASELLAKSELPGAAAIQQSITGRRKEAIRLLLPALRAYSARRTTSKWRIVLTPNGGGNIPLADTVQDRLPQIAKRFFKAAKGASSPDDLHHARIQGKKLRYSLELLKPAYDGQLDAAIQQTQEAQSLLGKAHDAHALRALVQELGGDADLEAWLKKRERKNTRKFQKTWDTASDMLQDKIRALKHPARRPAARATASKAPPGVKTA